MNKMPPERTMYKALIEKDSTFEGLFFVGVKTTGIFCRPTCPARKPKAKNVEFFSSSNDALYSGYRPCKRCHPLDKEINAPQFVTKLCDMIEKYPDKRISEAELKAMGIDPSTARRQFQKYYGMTFQAYHRARRMGQALHEIRKGKSVIGAQLDKGYDSASGFWAAFKHLFGVPPVKSEGVECLFAKWIDTPLGAMVAIANKKGLYLLEFVDRRGLENEIITLRKRTGFTILPGDNLHLDKITEEIKNYFDGKSISFTVPIVLTGSVFEQSVWKLLQKIPPGETRSYSYMAERLNKPGGARAIGRANGKNCIAIAIPCHRVIRADGSLCGYGGGVWRKQWLLNHEQKIVKKIISKS
ncbi:MAG: trifunctional transcriptional activator/DNA repair protein Ada/methylated-DNA--[protein]-cysteine S-methyltransferase [bacterium]